MKRRLDLDPGRAPLPKGTRVVLLVDVDARDGFTVKHGSLARVEETDHPAYVLLTPTGHTVDVQRDQVVVQSQRLADVVTERAWAWETFEEHVVLDVVVGSVAWGLDGPDSDEDRRGAFLLPFEHHAGLYDAPDVLEPAGAEATYWEVEKLVRQALRGDANTFEVLWSPRVRVETPVGRMLREHRHLFVSKNIHGAFGRYALSQLDKMRHKATQRHTEQAVIDALSEDPELSRQALVQRLSDGGLGSPEQVTDFVKRVSHALFDKGLTASRSFEDLRALLATNPPTIEPYRPKNAYNLLRLLHSGIRLAREGEPLIEVTDPDLRTRLLAIKAGEADLDDVIDEAQELALAFDDALAASSLPDEPDLDAANALVLRCRERAARRWFGLADGA